MKQCHELLGQSNNEPRLLPSSNRIDKWRSLTRRILNSSFTAARCCSRKHAVDTRSQQVSLEERGCSTGFMGIEITAANPWPPHPLPCSRAGPWRTHETRPECNLTTSGQLAQRPRRDRAMCAQLLSKLPSQRESHLLPKQTLIKCGDKGQDLESCWSPSLLSLRPGK